MLHHLAHRLSLFAIAALLFILAVPGWAGEVPIYIQNTNYNGGYNSQNDTTIGGFGNFATAYDNFTLLSAANINQVTWVGSYLPSPADPAGAISGFTVDFWGNSGNAPSSLLATYVVVGNAGETFLQDDNFGNPTYRYVLSLSSNFTAAAGTEYWLSIVPNLALPQLWAWEKSSQGDMNSYECYFGTCGNNPSDLAFGLYALQIPEPGSLALLVPGILGVAASLRRKHEVA
jgi:hypothetical protein